MEKLTKTISVRVSPGLRQRLEAIAKREKRTVNGLMRKYIEEGVEQDDVLAARATKRKKI